MKKILVAAAFLCATALSYAQSLLFEQQEIKGLGHDPAANATYLGTRDGLTLFITSKSNSNRSTIGSGIMLYGINEKNKADKSLVISKLRGCVLVTCSAVADTAYIIACGAVKDRDFDFFRLKVDLASWTVVGTPELVFEHKNKQVDWADWTVATSPDGHIRALSIKVVNEQSRIAKAFGKKDEESDVLLVTDNTLKTLWRRDDIPSWYASLTIDNDEVVHAMLAGINGNKTYFLFANHSSFNDESFLDSIDRIDLQSVQLLNYTDGHFVAGGTIGEERRALRNTQYTGTYALAYNTKTNKLTFNPQPLSSEEIEALNNVSKNHNNELEGLTTQKGSPTPFGGILQLYTAKHTIVYSNGGNFNVYQMGGSLISAIDTNANFLWRIPIRNTTSVTNVLHTVNQQVLHRNGHTYVIQTENAKNPTTYTSTERVSPVTMMPPTKTMLAIYAIDNNGSVTKHTLPLNKTLFFVGKLHTVNGEDFLNVGLMKKMRTIRIKGL